MSLGDMSNLGRSILRSTLLPHNTTRAWLKPAAHLDTFRSAVGRPWEIYRIDVPVSAGSNATRIVDLYSKNGALGAYQAYLILSPDHGIGISILLATDGINPADLTPHVLAEFLMTYWVPAAESAAREQAQLNFAGRYVPSGGVNSSITISTRPNRRMLGVTGYIVNGTDLLSPPGLPPGTPPAVIDLQYMAYQDGDKVSFRAISQGADLVLPRPAAILSRCGASWGALDSPRYGNIGLDEVWFVVAADGRAVSGVLPVMRDGLWKRTE
jgi:hypothetical protein